MHAVREDLVCLNFKITPNINREQSHFVRVLNITAVLDYPVISAAFGLTAAIER